MEIVFVTVIGAALGGLIRYLVPGRQWHGLGLMPSVGAAATALAWAILVWLGFTFDGGWIWVISLAVGVIASVATALLLPRRREKHDEELFERLVRQGA
ncbi:MULTISPECIES: hypothetical protein [unclassified Salinibacterium]|uniref:hypothetical protein n=1 Tax=unclassified Salinibacterium TaxID=2632331 RepID=UPI00141FB61A|nr:MULTISPECIES: hypothetical protein [unclassified Salinibacterium]